MVSAKCLQTMSFLKEHLTFAKQVQIKSYTVYYILSFKVMLDFLTMKAQASR